MNKDHVLHGHLAAQINCGSNCAPTPIVGGRRHVHGSEVAVARRQRDHQWSIATGAGILIGMRQSKIADGGKRREGKKSKEKRRERERTEEENDIERDRRKGNERGNK